MGRAAGWREKFCNEKSERQKAALSKPPTSSSHLSSRGSLCSRFFVSSSWRPSNLHLNQRWASSRLAVIWTCKSYQLKSQQRKLCFLCISSRDLFTQMFKDPNSECKVLATYLHNIRPTDGSDLWMQSWTPAAFMHLLVFPGCDQKVRGPRRKIRMKRTRWHCELW